MLADLSHYVVPAGEGAADETLAVEATMRAAGLIGGVARLDHLLNAVVNLLADASHGLAPLCLALDFVQLVACPAGEQGSLDVLDAVAGLQHDVGIAEEAHGHYAADSALTHLGTEIQEPGAQRLIGAKGSFDVRVVIQLDLSDAEAVEGGLIELVTSDVLAIGAGAEGVGSGDAHEIGMFEGRSLIRAVGHGHVAIGQRRVDDQQRVTVRSVDFIEQEDATFLVALDEVGAEVLEFTGFASGNQPSEQLSFAHAGGAGDAGEGQAQGFGYLLGQMGLAAAGRADQENVAASDSKAEGASVLGVRFALDGPDGVVGKLDLEALDGARLGQFCLHESTDFALIDG